MVNILIIEGDISTIEVDAVVNAANNHFWMGSGVAGALKRRGGPRIEEEAILKGPQPVGDAVITGAGSLPAGYVIHGAVMGQDLMTTADIVERTTVSCLQIALNEGIRTIAFPAFGCGVGGLTFRMSAEAMKTAIVSFDDGRLDDLDITIVLLGKEAFRVFRSVFQS